MQHPLQQLIHMVGCPGRLAEGDFWHSTLNRAGPWELVIVCEPRSDSYSPARVMVMCWRDILLFLIHIKLVIV